MRKSIIVFLSVLLVSCLILQEPVTLKVEAQMIEKQFDIESDINVICPIADTNFTQSPILGVNGTTNEFFATYGTDIEAIPFNYVELFWNRTEQNPIDFRDGATPCDLEPVCLDSAYFKFSFDWNYEVLPLGSVNILEFEVQKTGIFTSIDRYSDIRVYLLDSSGEYHRIHQKYLQYSSDYEYSYRSVSSFELIDAFDGMIRDESFNQDDPLDELQLIVMLSPTVHFRDSSQLSDGSVRVRIRYLNLEIYADVPPLLTVYEPVGQSSIPSEHPTEYCDMSISSNSTIYTLGRYRPIDEQGIGILAKWDDSTSTSWIVEWDDNRASGIFATDELVYAVGEIDDNILIITVTPDGVLESNVWNTSTHDRGLDVYVSPLNELIILGIRYIDGFPHPLLAKINPNDFSLVWNITFQDTLGIPRYNVEITNEGNIIAFISDYYFLYISTDGEILSQHDFGSQNYFLTLTDDDIIWTTGSIYSFADPWFTNSADLTLSKLDNETMDIIQTTTVSSPIDRFISESLIPFDITANSQGEITALVLKSSVSASMRLLHFDSEGNLLWNKMIQKGNGSSIGTDWIFWNELTYLDDNRLVIAGVTYDDELLSLAIYEINSFSNNNPIDWVLIGAIAGAVVIVDIVLISVFRRRRLTRRETGGNLEEDLSELFDNA